MCNESSGDYDRSWPGIGATGNVRCIPHSVCHDAPCVSLRYERKASKMKRMLISGTDAEGVHIAIADDETLHHLERDRPGEAYEASKIFKARITRLDRTRDLAFLDYGAAAHGTLPIKGLAPHCLRQRLFGFFPIRPKVHEGQAALVQIDRTRTDSDTVRLTTSLLLTSGGMVLMPQGSADGASISTVTMTDAGLDVPKGMRLLQQGSMRWNPQRHIFERDTLLATWQAIRCAAAKLPAPCLLYRDTPLYLRMAIDHPAEEIPTILVECPKVFASLRAHLAELRPARLHGLRLETDAPPLFERFRVLALSQRRTSAPGIGEHIS